LTQTVSSGVLTLIDWLIISAYFIFIVWLGARFRKKQKSSERYFLGKRNLPGWAVGISMFATIISSWAFIALPGKSFKNDMQYLMTISTIPISTFIAARYLIPLFRDKIKLSAYEYLEKRFGLPARVYGNVAFIIIHFGKMGAILYLLCLAISGMTGWDIFILITIVGMATITYTFFGGIEGVVWSDVTQGFLLLSGGIISLLYLFFSVPGGPLYLLSEAYTAQKLKLISLQFDWHTVNVWVLLFFGFNFYLQKYSSDQTVVQRYLLSPTSKQASGALWISSLLIMLVWFLFMSIGALLWTFYSLKPGLLPEPLWTQPDSVFPYFIGHQLPVGVSGLILAALMAATMSTLSSDLNSLAAILYDDYYNKLRKDRTDVQRLFFSRMSVLITGLLAIVLAMWMTQIKSMADAAFNFVSLVAGGVLGMYLLGIFSKRCSKKGLYIGISIGVTFILWAYFSGPDQYVYIRWLPKFPLHVLWIGLFGNVVVFVTGYLASLLISPGYKAEYSLTVYRAKGELTPQKKGN
jgi:SSS family solute:Na+ symporter